MFTNLKPYPEYQETVVDRFAGIPVHWEHKRLRYLFREVDVRSSRGTERPLSMSQSLGLVPAEDVQRSLSASSYVGGKLCLPGDIILNRLKAHLGVFAVSQQSGVVSPDYTVLRTIAATDPTYFERLLRSEVLRTELRRRTKGIVEGFWRLYTDDFYDIVVPVPPTDEQAAIVKYLRHANARIDRAISAKRKLIALLEEQKQAVMNQAVTRGLDPNVSMKDPGIPWVDRVPVHWPVAALRQRYSQSLGKMLDSSRIVGNDLLPYLRNADVQWDRINMADLPEMDISEAEFDRYTLEAGDLLVCEGGDVGRAAIWGNVGRVGYQKALHRLRPADANEDVPRYLLYGLRVASKAGAFSDGHVSTIAHLTGEKLRAHRFAWPSAAEQQSIVDHLDSSTAATNRTIDRVSHEIELLREFRTRLTADVVTGQVDIRDAVALLPELDPPDLVSDDSGPDEDDLEAELAASLEEVDS